GPHTPDNPEWGRCEDFGITFDGLEAVWEQELRHEGGGGGPYMERERVDISSLHLPPIANNWIGLMWRDRRVLKEDDRKLLGRILQIKVNPNPFDPNRNVLNDNWIDVTAFLDKGQFKDDKGKPFPIISGPANPTKYQDTVRVDGQNASTYGVRFPRYCGIEPIIVKDEAEMDKLFKDLRNDSDDNEEPTNKPPKVKVGEKVITVTQDKMHVTLDARGTTDPEGGNLKYNWKQMSGNPKIPLSDLALQSPNIDFEFDRTYGTADFQITVMDDHGLTASETVKVVNAINQNPEDTKFIEPKYPMNMEDKDLYFRMQDYIR